MRLPGAHGSFGLLIAFGRDDPAYVEGFEAGMLYAELSFSSPEILRDVPLHIANREIAERIATANGYRVLIEELKEDLEGWCRATFYRRGPEGEG